MTVNQGSLTIFKYFSGFEFFSVPKQYPRQPGRCKRKPFSVTGVYNLTNHPPDVKAIGKK